MSVIDRLVVELGLDAKNFARPARESVEELRKLEKQSARAGTNLEATGKKGADAFSGIRREALAMFAVFTAGKSLKSFVADTTKATAQLGYMSQRLNMDPSQLYKLESAAQAAGGAFGEVTQSFAALQQRLADPAEWGKIGRAFSQLGVPDFKDKNGRVRGDIISVLNQRFNERHTDKAVETRNLQDAGFGEGVINLVEMDRAKFLRIQKKTDSFRAPTRSDTEQLEKLYQNWSLLKKQSEALSTSLVAKLAPNLDVVIDKLSKFEGDHPDLTGGIAAITLAVNELTKSFNGLGSVLAGLAGYRLLKGVLRGGKNAASFLGRAASAVGTEAGSFLSKESMGRLGLAGATIAEGLSVNSTINDSRRRADQAYEASTHKQEHRQLLYDGLIRSGFPRNAALGVIGNLERESRLDAGAVGDWDFLGRPQAFGIAQWHKRRVDDIQKRFGIDVRTAGFEDQVRALILEMKSGDDAGARRAGANLSRPGITLADGVREFRQNFERPKNRDGMEDMRRMAFAANAGTSIADTSSPAPVNHTTNLNGDIVIHTQATDAKGISKDVEQELRHRLPPVNIRGLQ